MAIATQLSTGKRKITIKQKYTLGIYQKITDCFYDSATFMIQLIRRKGAPFEGMTGRTVPSSEGLLAEVFGGFPQM